MHGRATRRGDAQLNEVAAGRRDIRRVVQPFSGRRPPDVVAALGRRLDVHVSSAILAAAVARRLVVVGHAFAAAVKIFGPDLSGNRRSRSQVGCRRRRGQRRGRSDRQESAQSQSAHWPPPGLQVMPHHSGSSTRLDLATRAASVSALAARAQREVVRAEKLAWVVVTPALSKSRSDESEARSEILRVFCSRAAEANRILCVISNQPSCSNVIRAQLQLRAPSSSRKSRRSEKNFPRECSLRWCYTRYARCIVRQSRYVGPTRDSSDSSARQMDAGTRVPRAGDPDRDQLARPPPAIRGDDRHAVRARDGRTGDLRQYDIFLPDYMRSVFRPVAAVKGPTHVFFLFADHFEPLFSVERTRQWADRYRAMALQHRDSTGRVLQHTWFYPGDQFEPRILGILRQLMADGFGEVELHYHHADDSPETLRVALKYAIKRFQTFGFLKTVDGRTAFAFVHGNEGLDNADGELCGVNDELRILHSFGCFADYTFPALDHRAQPPFVNSLYAARDDPQPKSDRTRWPLLYCKSGAADLMIFQGPLTLAPSWNLRRLFIDVDDGNIHATTPAERDARAALGECACARRRAA